MTSASIIVQAARALLDSQLVAAARGQLCKQCQRSQAHAARHVHVQSSALCAPALQEPQPHNQAELTWWQHVRVSSILKRRRAEAARHDRARELAGFRKAARRGDLDMHVPVRSMYDVMMSDYRHLDGILPEEPKQLEGEGTGSANIAANGALAQPPEQLPEAEAQQGSVEGGTVRLPGIIFSRPPSAHVLYQVVRWQLAKRRSGTASSKKRGEVRGGGRKPHPQKGSGRARAGTIRAPHMRGGSVAHGPRPRSFAFHLTKRTRKAGLMAALSTKAQAGEIVVVDKFFPLEAELRAVFGRVLLANMPELKRTDKFRIKNPWLREAIAPHGFEPSMYGELDDSGKFIATFFPDETIVKRLLRKLDDDQVSYAVLLARTGWFVHQLKKLQPQGWDAQPEGLEVGSQLLESLNPGFSQDRLARMQRKRRVKTYPSMLVVDSDADAGYDEADLLRRVTRNVGTINPLPARGLNVFDILRHRTLVFTLDALGDTIQRCLRPALRGFKRPGESWLDIVARRRAAERNAAARRPEVTQWLQERGVWVPEPAVAAGVQESGEGVPVRMMDVDAPPPAA